MIIAHVSTRCKHDAHVLDEIVVCIYVSRRDLCAFVYILVEILIMGLCGSGNPRRAVGLDKLRVLWYARLGHKYQRHLSKYQRHLSKYQRHLSTILYHSQHNTQLILNYNKLLRMLPQTHTHLFKY